MVNLTSIIEAIIALACALITVFLVPYIKSKHSVEEIAKTVDMVRIFVAAAQQMAEAMGWDGEAKKEHVIAMLAQNGIAIDMTINDMIEAEVIKLKNELVK